MIDLSQKYFEDVKRILYAHVPDYEVRAFGSRVDKKAKEYSDLDIVLVGTRALDWRLLEKLKQAFSQSDLPFMVDVIDWHAISDEFKKVIEAKYEVIQHPTHP